MRDEREEGRVTTRWRILSETRIHICVRAHNPTHTLRVRWLPREYTRACFFPFFTGWTKVVFLKRERSARRPVNLSLALLLGPFRSSQNGGPPSAPSWLISAAVAAATMVLVLGRLVLEALDLSAGLLWGMLTCPREMLFSVLDSPLASSSGPFPIFLFIFFFFPLARARTVYVYSIISFSFSRRRVRASNRSYADRSLG